jgi:hypothetical protein
VNEQGLSSGVFDQARKADWRLYIAEMRRDKTR